MVFEAYLSPLTFNVRCLSCPFLCLFKYPHMRWFLILTHPCSLLHFPVLFSTVYNLKKDWFDVADQQHSPNFEKSSSSFFERRHFNFFWLCLSILQLKKQYGRKYKKQYRLHTNIIYHVPSHSALLSLAYCIECKFDAKPCFSQISSTH